MTNEIKQILEKDKEVIEGTDRDVGASDYLTGVWKHAKHFDPIKTKQLVDALEVAVVTMDYCSDVHNVGKMRKARHALAHVQSILEGKNK